jgi:polar amino acid transport system substrate-binding protein
MKKYLCAVFFSVLMLQTGAVGGDKIRYAIFPAPPYMIGEDREGQDVSGIDVDIVREIARRMKLEVEYVRCPWARCLAMMQSGEADLLSSVWKRPEREAYLRFFDTPFLDELPITFYFKKGSGRIIDKYEDLYLLNSIGVLRGAGYFNRFDKDAKLKKQEVTSQDQLLPMLMNDRFEAMAGYVPTENYRLVVEGYVGKIERAAYEFIENAPIYMAISRKSPLVGRFDEFNQVNSALANEGVLKRIRDVYYQRYEPKE